MRHLLRSAILAPVLAGLAPDGAGAAAYSFARTGEVPGAILTRPLGLNDKGQVAGYYHDTAGNHGYVETAGSFTTIDVPGSSAVFASGPGVETIATAINNAGQVVGQYDTENEGYTHTRSFLYAGGTLTAIEVPGSPTTAAFGLNDKGQVTGFYDDLATYKLRGFVYADGVFTTIDAPGDGFTHPYAINNAGEIAGSYNAYYNSLGFLRDASGAFTTVEVPRSGSTVDDDGNRATVPATLVRSLNDKGQIIGEYRDDTGSHSFLGTAGVFASLPLPNPTPYRLPWAEIYGINNAGQIVGDYTKTVQSSYGILGTPEAAAAVPEPGSLALLGAGLLGLAAVRAGRRLAA